MGGRFEAGATDPTFASGTHGSDFGSIGSRRIDRQGGVTGKSGRSVAAIRRHSSPVA
jgi:hypothetical protein